MTALSALPARPAAVSAPEAAPEPSRLVAEVSALLRFGVIMAAVLAAASLPSSSFFVVRQVVVAGVGTLPPAEVVAASGLRPGDRLLSASPARVAERVRALPAVASAQVVLGIGGRATIRVVERRPVAAVRHRLRYLIVDSSGHVISAQASPGRLPVIVVDGLAPAWVRLGDRLPDPRLAPALAALSGLPDDVVTPGVIVRADAAGELALVTPDRITVRLGPLRGLPERAAQLSALLDAVRDRGLAIEYLDLRFAGSVVMKPAAADGGGERR